MDLVRFLEVRGHLGQQFIGPYTDIDSNPELLLDFIFQRLRHFRRVFPVEPECHVNETFIDGKLLKDSARLRLKARSRALPL